MQRRGQRKGKGIWPTSAEITSGRYTLHHDYAGAELPMIPATTYSKCPSNQVGNSLSYYFKVIPVNTYGQAPNPVHFSQPSIVLPDTLPPSKPGTVDVSPSAWTKADTINVSWTGVTDFNNTAGGASSSLGTGRIQYKIDETGSWLNTDKNSANDTFAFPTSGVPDGSHAIYIRGVDSAGNIGERRGVGFLIDKTGPTAPTLSVTPVSWTKENLVSLSWSEISDQIALDRVEYFIDSGSWTTTGLTGNNYSGYGISIASLASGTHTIAVCGVDIVGNIGTQSTMTIYKDVLAPVVTDVSVVPPSWTTSDNVDISWTGLSDIHSGMKVVSYELDGTAAIDLPSVLGDDSFTIDATALDDGEHTVALNFIDQKDNTLTRTIKFYRDVTKPNTSIISPLDADIVNGMMEIWGSVDDISLEPHDFSVLTISF